MSRRSNWLLFLLSGGVPKHRPPEMIWLDPISIMKALFLAQHETGRGPDERRDFADPPFSFVPYSYGPFTPVVYTELESLATSGLVQSQRAPGRSYSLWALTESGWSAARAAARALSADERTRIAHAYDVVTSKSFNALLAYVYGRYPESATRSIHPAASAR